ncbi:MAG: polyphosphate kinase 2 family protein [Deltaproteobacteria bacterium]|jgi:PPK2 family polyphosphate:nucleotide phosphotransferase|nr:polyphosphate kinase 2 family protein [Deltaproteobacteria bacterium]MBW2531834.1 polyphosphate kinase 2 family protein [Deltaproteobacteria bacterium]
MKKYRVKPGTKVKLSKWDPADKSQFDGGKEAGLARVAELNQRLEQLQELLYAEGRHQVLVVLQGMDAAGKDGCIRHVFEGVNPQGVEVASFGKPSKVELSHDYLWRIHQHAPARGKMVIFNRSHYEDVLVVRVHGLVPEKVWRKRYGHINDFERMLTDEGATIVKFYLHIDRDEQKERFQARLDEPDKRWKFRRGDLDERKLWPKYQKAFEAVLSETSTEWAPWYIVPANRKWYRNLVVLSALVETLEKLGMSFPQPETGLDDVVID